jgi:hypothetical protein
MRAGDVAVPMTTVVEDMPARDAARVLASQDLPGLGGGRPAGAAVDGAGRHAGAADGVAALLPGRPGAARVVDEAAADVLLDGIGDRTVADLLPRNRPELPAVGAEATLLEVASVMARSNVPLVAVVERTGS